ncbi:MAG TPA: hypothetical protein VG370_24690 [Chloroflexota bacterium]|nr:hypothetical protein [Chloroflexota bacterium]
MGSRRAASGSSRAEGVRPRVRRGRPSPEALAGRVPIVLTRRDGEILDAVHRGRSPPGSARVERPEGTTSDVTLRLQSRQP